MWSSTLLFLLLLIRYSNIHPNLKVCRQLRDWCLPPWDCFRYLRSWIQLDLHMRTLSLLQARAQMSLTRDPQMRAPKTCSTISLLANHPWPWHCISWWGWGACTRCPCPTPHHLSIFNSRMRLQWYHLTACIRLLLVELHRLSYENLYFLDHPLKPDTSFLL